MLHDLAARAARETPDQAALPPLRANGSLVRALQQARAQGLPVIAELKLASPSEGTLLHGGTEGYLDAVRRGGACALSAVTAGGRFQGSLQTLRDAHRAGLPCLMKDFVTQASQLDAAVRHGASAVLLIERLLGPAREDLVRAAHERGLEVLLEVHGDAEAHVARPSRADVLGVNSRDLATLAIDLPAALRTVATLARERPTLLLSGVNGPAEAEAARAAGAAGVLVGTSLLRARDPALTLRALRRPVAKVCGNRDANDVAAALSAGADLVGVIVGAGSARDVPPEQAAALLRQATAGGATAVAVTRHKRHGELIELAQVLRPTFLQVHGDLPAASVAALRTLGVGVLHAVAPGDQPAQGCDGTVTDATREGGSGRRHAGDVPHAPGLHLVAGGLDGELAAEAVQRSGAHGADASSRLEAGDRKDPAKVAAFVAATHAATRRPHGA